MKIKRLITLACVCLLPSCTVYQQNFESKPTPGIEHASVIDLEQMIIETPQGPDLFYYGYAPDCASMAANCKKRIWVNGYRSEKGCWVAAHYVYLQ